MSDFFSEHLVEKSDKLVWTGLLAGNGYRYYRYKIDLEAKTDCRDQSGYSAPIDLHDSPVIERALPLEGQSYRVCIQGGDSAATADTWYQSNFPTVVHFNVRLASCMVTLMGYFQPLKSQVGVDEFPSRFDPVNKGTCDFLIPPESVTVELLQNGKIKASDTLVLNVTADRLEFPLDGFSVLPDDLPEGSYDRRIYATTGDGTIIDITSRENVWIFGSSYEAEAAVFVVEELVRIGQRRDLRVERNVEWDVRCEDSVAKAEVDRGLPGRSGAQHR